MSDSLFYSFASKVLILTVGPKNVPFNIHEALLQIKTSFFEVHTEPNGGTNPAHATDTEPERVFKNESTPSTDTDTSQPPNGIPTPSMSSAAGDAAGNESEPHHEEPNAVMADYHLDTHFVKGFGIFVHWLYNAAPQDPKTASQCKVLIQAYLLALKYSAKGLQNLLLDCIRRYHIENQVNFDLFFIYLLNRHGDDADCKLIKYFMDQIAYEIMDSGIEEFDSANAGFDFFMRERPQGVVRTALFHVLSKLSTKAHHGGKNGDPAVAKVHDYYV